MTIYTFLFRSARARRRRLNLSKKEFSEGIDKLPTSEDIELDGPGARSKNYIADDESERPVTVNSFLSSGPEKSRPTSSVKDERIVSPKSVKIKGNVQLPKEVVPSVEPHPQQPNSEEETTFIGKPSKSQISSATVLYIESIVDYCRPD